MIIKLKAQESSCNSTPQSYSGQRYIRMFNNTAGAVLVTQRDSGNNVLGSISMVANTELVLSKNSTDTFEANAAIKAVPVGAA
jgi:hypothetical protein